MEGLNYQESTAFVLIWVHASPSYEYYTVHTQINHSKLYQLHATANLGSDPSKSTYWSSRIKPTSLITKIKNILLKKNIPWKHCKRYTNLFTCKQKMTYIMCHLSFLWHYKNDMFPKDWLIMIHFQILAAYITIKNYD